MSTDDAESQPSDTELFRLFKFERVLNDGSGLLKTR